MKISATKNQAGLTLVELMVSLVLSLVLLGGVIQMFVSNKQGYQLSDELARMQESARFASFLLERDLRMAGYTGCSSRDESTMRVKNTLNGSTVGFSPTKGIEGWEAGSTNYGAYSIVANGATSDASVSGWATSDGATLATGTMSVGNSDIVRVWLTAGSPLLVNNITPGANTVVDVSINADFEDDDILILTDCTKVDIVQACSVGQTSSGGVTSINAILSNGCTPGNDVSATLLNTKDDSDNKNVHVAKLIGRIYFIGKRGNTSTNPPALFRQEIGQNAAAGTAEELVEGVESMQILYGEDTAADADGEADRYVDAEDVDDWEKVVSVRIEMLMQSSRVDLVDGEQKFNFNGTTVTSTDGRLRYPFVSTIALRNRTE